MTATDSTLPRNIDEYLAQLRRALEGADPAMIQDALSDAEEHLRAECAARPADSEETVLRAIADSYGSPEDVAAAYRETERTVQAALSPVRRIPAGAAASAAAATAAAAGAAATVTTATAAQRTTPPQGLLRRFFSAWSDSRSWTSLFFMLTTLVTGIFYFTVVVTGMSLSLGLAILIIGFPFFIAFLSFTRVLALVEGRLIEGLTGERMPRRATPPAPGGWFARIGAMLRDLRTWTTLVYQLLMLPLGIAYFTVAVTLGALGLGLLGGSVVGLLQALGFKVVDGWQTSVGGVPLTGIEALGVAIASLIIGALLVTALLHLARLVGRFHGRLAKQLLVAR
jgi:hypothetical protein